MASSSSSSTTIGRFKIVKRLGRGAQGAVFLAQDPDLDRLVALKLVNEVAALQDGESQISAQARNLAQLRHPNIVALYECGRFHNFNYLVFEYLEGVPLAAELDKRGALPLPEAYSLMVQIVDAMAYAHAKGILHLDLNPNNVMRDESGKPRIMDFDLSRRVASAVQSDLVAGTIPYMAPEQLRDGLADTRTDVFALGRIFYECLTGLRAVPALSQTSMIAHICFRETDLAPLLAADREGLFADIVVRASSKDPAQRFATAREMHEAMLAAWSRMRSARDAQAAAVHGTIGFVMKRIERKGDFPAISKTLAEVNQLTRDGSQTPVSRLTNVVLRDFALTSRLLKLANSSYYARMSGKVKSVSDAISLMGVDQVRLTCNGLACFGHFAGKKESHRLRDASVEAFIAGLIARHVAASAAPKAGEEAFLSGMLFHLGRMLTLFYFPDDFEDIEALQAAGASEAEAARSVLGITLQDIGHAVGAAWGLPAAVLACMSETQDDADTEDATVLRRAATFANGLVALALRGGHESGEASRLEALECLPGVGPAVAHDLLNAAVQKFKAFAPALEVDCSQSNVVLCLDTWLAAAGAELAAREAATGSDASQAAA